MRKRKTLTVTAGREEKMGDDDEDPLLSTRVVSTKETEVAEMVGGGARRESGLTVESHASIRVNSLARQTLVRE